MDFKLEHCEPTRSKARPEQGALDLGEVSPRAPEIEPGAALDCWKCQQLYPEVYRACKQRLQVGITGCKQLF